MGDDDTYYRHLLAQMQHEFSRAVAALEKQVAALTRHNALLTKELSQTKEHQTMWRVQAAAQVHQLQQEVARQETEASERLRAGVKREEALCLEVAALKSLVQHETEYWTRVEQASRDERDGERRRVAEAKAEMVQYDADNQRLRCEMMALQKRVETAVARNTSLEQRLTDVVQEKQETLEQMEVQLHQYRKKLHDKRVQKRYLTDALVRLQERESTSRDASGGPIEAPVPRTTGLAQRRVRKREWTGPDEMKAATQAAATTTRLKSKRLTSSPDSSPRSARAAPYKRAPSVATTTPTASDGNSFNSSGSVRSLRSLRHVTGRRRSCRNSSDSDSVDVSPTTNGAHRQGVNPTGRLERELSGLRRKLDSCMADTAARW